MKRLIRMMFLVGAVLTINLAAKANEAAALGFPCYACSGDCSWVYGELACNIQCNGMHAKYCVGDDQWGYCDPYFFSTVIECEE